MESRGFLSGSVVKNLPANPGDTGDLGSMIPCKRKWQPTPVFLPGGSRGQRSLVGYSPQGRKESATTERLQLHSLKYTNFNKVENSFFLTNKNL